MLRHLKTLGLALAGLLLAAGPALATGSVRLEYLKSNQVLNGETISSSGASVQGSAAPNFGGVQGYVRIRGVGGAAIVTNAAASPTATQANGYRIQACDLAITLPIQTGQKVAIIEATDASTCTSAGLDAGAIADIHTIALAAADLSTPSPTTLSATSGCTPGYTLTTASTNASNIKASPGTLCGGLAINTTGTLAYDRYYDTAGTPTCSSATGFKFAIPIPASTSGAGTPLQFGPAGALFTAGIAHCVTGGGSSTDNTNAVAGVYIVPTYK